MATVELKMAPREEKGKGPMRRLRSEGLLPAVIYGGGKEPMKVKMQMNDAERLLARESYNAILDLNIDGVKEKTIAMIKEVQQETVSSKLIHIDFIRISLDQKVQVSIPVELTNLESVRRKGGITQLILSEIPVECLPDRIPDNVVIDMTGMEIGDSIQLKELPLPEGVESLLDQEDYVLSVLAPRIEKQKAAEEEEGEEGIEGEEGAEGAEGEEGEEGAGGESAEGGGEEKKD